MDKVQVFQEELSWITDDRIRQFAKTAVSQLPDYFFRVAASSTGKYHPEYALGPGGLVRHTKAAVKIAKELLSLEMYGRYSDIEKNLIYTAIILHDGWKHGPEKDEQITERSYTIAAHPTLCAKWLRSINEWNTCLTEDEMCILETAIASHMGQWNTDYRSKKAILPKPVTAIQKFVHQCDYLASRKWLLVDFGDSYYEPEVDPAPDEKPSKEQLALQKMIDQIIELCKCKVSQGAKHKELYAIIAELNSGNRNPNSIPTLDLATQIFETIDKMEVSPSGHSDS